MNEIRARIVLGIDNEINITPDLLKRQYRINALRFHPDKNSSPNANEQFLLVKEAYDFLSDNKAPIENTSYADILREFLNTKSPIIHIIITKLSNICREKAFQLINSIDKLILMDIYKLLLSHKEILYVPDYLIDEIRKILISKTQGDERYILNPSLEDLWENNVYRLVVDERIYMIPLWHNELVYDNSGCDLYVKCNPILPDNIEIDQDNNLIIALEYKIADLLQIDKTIVVVGGREFIIHNNELRIVKYQTLTQVGIGISRINSKNIYEISTKGDVIFHIFLH